MLEGGKTILRMGRYELRTRELIVVGVLALAFTTAFIMRSYPSKYGFYLNEFDPYFDYRATKYIVDHGLNAYFKWHDTMSWYPEGRDVPATSQSGLHIVAAFLYKIFGAGSSLLDFTILLPVILGSLTTIVVFALVRTLSGTSAGLFSALLFAFSPAIIQRGNLGWFESEPLGLFFALLATYLFISSIKNRPGIAIMTAVAGGLILGLANASWGGVQYFSIPISIFFTIGFKIKRFTNERKYARNNLIALGAFVVIGIAIISSGVFHTASFRYLNAINPFLSSQNPLVESVAEH